MAGSVVHGTPGLGPSGAYVLRLVVGSNAVAAGLGIWLGWAVWRTPDTFFRGHLLDTTVSAVQLLAIAALCRQVFRVREATPAAPAPALWRLLAVAFLFFSVDEVAELHERLDKGLHALFGVTETALTDRLDDFIVGGYGVAGLAVLWRFRAEVACFRPLAGHLLAAAVAIASMVMLDVLTSRADVVLVAAGPE